MSFEKQTANYMFLARHERPDPAEPFRRLSDKEMITSLVRSDLPAHRMSFMAEIAGQLNSGFITSQMRKIARDSLMKLMKNPSSLVRLGVVLGLSWHLDDVDARMALVFAGHEDPDPIVRSLCWAVITRQDKCLLDGHFADEVIREIEFYQVACAQYDEGLSRAAVETTTLAIAGANSTIRKITAVTSNWERCSHVLDATLLRLSGYSNFIRSAGIGDRTCAS